MLILASQSPRRRDLLAHAGLCFRVELRDTEELHDASLPPEELCARNAAAKAEAVAAEFPQDTIIGADTLVFLDGEPLGKPADEVEAAAMLSRLQGRSHKVCTAVALILPGGERRDFVETTEVRFLPLDAAAIARYLEAVHVLDKAGAYAIQEHGEMIIEGISGDLDNVIGLPVTRLLSLLPACP